MAKTKQDIIKKTLEKYPNVTYDHDTDTLHIPNGNSMFMLSGDDYAEMVRIQMSDSIHLNAAITA